MSEMPIYKSIDESVLSNFANRMAAANHSGDREAFEYYKEQLANTISALGSLSPITRAKYEHLIGASFEGDLGNKGC